MLAGLAGHAFFLGGFGAAMGAFITAAFVIVVMMFLLAFSIASAQEQVIKAVRAHVVEVKRWGGWILIIVGTWFLILAVFADFFRRIFPV